MQNVKRRKKDFKLDFFENGMDEIKDVVKAKNLIDDGEKIRARGYVELNGQNVRVRTAEITGITLFKNIAKLYTENMEYNMPIA